MRRAAVAVPSNIAEGQGRRTDGEFLNLLSVAHGSLRELETQLMLCERLRSTRWQGRRRRARAGCGGRTTRHRPRELHRKRSALTTARSPLPAACQLPAAGCQLQQPRVERQRQQIAQLVAAGLAAQVREDHFDVAAELPEDLAARAARRRRRLRCRRRRRCGGSVRWPSDSALNIATRSAHIVRP